MPSIKTPAQCLFILSVALTGASYSFEYALALIPCTLCLLQRYLVILIALSAGLMLLIQRARWAMHLLSALLTTSALAGLTLATRHVWLQQLPADERALAGCAPALSYLIKQLPLTDVLERIWHPSSDCGEVSWTFLGLSMAAWMVFWFSVLLVLSMVQWYYVPRNPRHVATF